MKKAAPKDQQSPSSLGTKRVCPQCATKFYDFSKAEISCPKCETQYDVDKLSQMTRTPVELKRPAKALEKTASGGPLLQTEELVTDETESFESVDELTDDDDDLVEDLEVDDEEHEY